MIAMTPRQRFALEFVGTLLLITFAISVRATTLVAMGTLYPDPMHSGQYLGSSYAYAINDSGMAVGQASVNRSNMHAFTWTSSAGMTDLLTHFIRIRFIRANIWATVVRTASIPVDR